MPGRTLLRRVALLILGLLAAAAGTLALVVIVHRKGLNWTADSATVGAFVVAILALFSSGIRRWWRGPAPVSQLSLDEAVERLFPVLLAQWSERTSDRQVDDPGAMQVQFKVTGFTRSLMTTVPVGGGPGGRAGIDPDDELSGSFVNVLDVFRKVQRLVITGPAGAGKSVLAIKLACDLSAWQKARSRELAEIRLPVVVSCSAWNPRQSLDQWIASELVSIDQELSRRPRGAADKHTTLAQAMALSRVIPIIDGIDELPGRLRGEAIRRINEAGSNRSLVVTSRPAEYSGALKAADREISRAAVVAVQPLTQSGAQAYLREAATPRSLPRWQLVFERMEREPEGPLATALTNPLLLWLCRRIYSQGDRDPGELVGRSDLGHLQAIENHLFGAFLPAIYRSDGRQSSPWTAAQARQWLGFLAGFMEQSRSPDLAWWRLRTTVAGWRTVSTLVRGAALSALACWLAVWVLRRAGDWRGGSYTGRAGSGKLLFNGPAGQAIQSAIGRLIAAVSIEGPAPKAQDTQASWPFSFLDPILHLVPWPLYVIIPGAILFAVWSAELDPGAPVTFRLRQSLTRTLTELAGFLLAAVTAIELIMHVPHWPAAAQAPVSRGLFLLVAIGVAVMFVPQIFRLAPADNYGSKNPVAVLRGDRKAFVLAAVMLLIPLAAVWAVCGTAIGVAVGIVGGVALLSEFVSGTLASGAFVETRAWLALTRRMPLRALTFLEDAHRRGALARTGSTYQFRHLQLQRYLAQSHMPLLQRLALSRLGSRIWDYHPLAPFSADAWTRPVWARRFAEQAAALAPVLGRCEPAGPVYGEPPGVVQRFGAPDGQGWVMCAMPGQGPLMVADSLWNLLHEVRAATADERDALRLLGFPTLPAVTLTLKRLIPPEASRLTLDGGRWGPSVLERDADGGWHWCPGVQSRFSERLSSRRRDKGVRVDVQVTMPCAHPDLAVSRPLAQKLKSTVSGTDLVSVMRALGPPGQECAVRASAGVNKSYRWRADIGSLPPAAAVITVIPLSGQVSVGLTVEIEAGVHTGASGRLGLAVEPLRAILMAAWEATVDVIPGVIASDLAESLTGRPSISLSLLAPSTPEEILHLGTDADVRKARRASRALVTKRTVTISGWIVALSEPERHKHVQDALTSLAPGFGYQVT